MLLINKRPALQQKLQKKYQFSRGFPRLIPAVSWIYMSNRLLSSIGATDLELMRPFIRMVDLVDGAVIYEAGDTIQHVYFPDSGIISLVMCLDDGQSIEVAMIGNDSVLGASSALDGLISLNRSVVQLPGTAQRLEVDCLRRVAEQSLDFRTTLIRHEQALFAQAQQSAACNATHTAKRRLSRWLLRVRDLAGSNVVAITQEILGQVMGTRRSSVSLAATQLQAAGLIRYRRGVIQIIDRPGLEASACECYAMVKAQSNRLLNADPRAGVA